MPRVAVDLDALKRERKRILDDAGAILTEASEAEGKLEADKQVEYNDLMKKAGDLLTRIRNEEEMRLAEQATDDAGQPIIKTSPIEAGSYLGMTKQDVDKFSLRRLFAAKAGLISRKEADFELQVDEAVAKRSGKSYETHGGQAVAHIPFEVMAGTEKRDLDVATEGADIVEVTHGSVIELLRNRMVTRAAGVRILTGLRGDLLLPKHTAATTNTAWVANEASGPTEGVATFGQVKFQPSQLACYTDISRQALLQSSFDVEQFIRMDLASNIAIEIDRTVLHGSGSGTEPAGVFNTGSIGDVAGGTNGADPTWAHIVELETDVSVANADMGSLAYITNAKVRGKLKNTERVASTGLFVWQDPANVSPATPAQPLNGYRAFVTNQVASNLTKGSVSTCSAIFFGNWEEGIVAFWADLDVLVDPYTGGSAGIVRLIALANADFQVRHPESFSVMKDATT